MFGVRRWWLWLVVGLVSIASAAPALAGDANVPVCPNEGLSGYRAALPDCRAYEMISPAFVGGVRTQPVAVSGDGQQVVASSGGFGETESDPFTTTYLMSRDSGSWLTTSLAPPDSIFSEQEAMGANPVLGLSLWGLRTHAQSIYVQDLYLREADGSFVRIGPMVPPGAAAGAPAGTTEAFYYAPRIKYVAASGSYSHIVTAMTGNGPLWPEDTTALHEQNLSLYEYSGKGVTHPELVGVSDGHTSVNGEVLPHGALISQCEVSLGSEGLNDLYNAMSLGGERLFITVRGHDKGNCPNVPEVRAPAVSEVYARLGGEETVDLSEPSSMQCQACQTGEPADAEFAGASEDGSKVFFVTKQALLGEDASTNIYEYDFNAKRGQQVHEISTGGVKAEVQGVSRVSEDGSHVYFVATGVLTGGEENEYGAVAQPEQDNFYVYEHDAVYPSGHITFIATLSGGDHQDWASEDRREVQASHDGQFVVFQSEAPVTPGASGSSKEIFEYDAATDELVRVSRGQAGFAEGIAKANMGSFAIPRQDYALQVGSASASSGSAMADDGATVVFQGPAGATQDSETAVAAGVESVYEYHSSGAISSGEVYELSDGSESLGASFGGIAGGIDASGGDVFFESGDDLVPGHVDSQRALYDARVDGGQAVTSAPEGCAGSVCEGAAPALPVINPSGTALVGAVGPYKAGLTSGGSVRLPKALSRAERLTAALRACRHEARRRRAKCLARAKTRYGVTSKGAR